MTADAVGGVWTYALSLAQGLAEAGSETILVVAGPAPSEAQRSRAASIDGVTLVEIDAPLDWTAQHEGDLARTAAAIAEIAAANSPDALHLNTPALAAYAAFEAPVLGVCHSCLATWWRAVKGTAVPAQFDWRVAAVSRGYAACETLVAPSHAFAAATVTYYGGPMPTVVHNGRVPQASQRHASPEPIVLSAGRLWDEGKDVRTLDAAAASIAARVVALGPVVAPDGSRARFDRLETVGVADDAGVAAWMAGAEVFVSTARYEPFGLAVLEAAQAGLPLVLSDIATFRELWSDAAVFVEPGDAAEFAAACNRLLRDPAARRTCGEAARRRAAHYDGRSMSNAYLDLYRRLAETGARSSCGVPA